VTYQPAEEIFCNTYDLYSSFMWDVSINHFCDCKNVISTKEVTHLLSQQRHLTQSEGSELMLINTVLLPSVFISM